MHTLLWFDKRRVLTQPKIMRGLYKGRDQAEQI